MAREDENDKNRNKMEENQVALGEDTDVVVGLDIGTTKVVAVVGCRDKKSGKIRILGYGRTESVGVVRGAVINLEKTAQAIHVAVEEASANSEIDIKEVYVGIAGQHIRSYPSETSYVREDRERVFTRQEIEDLKRQMSCSKVMAGERIIHVIPQTFEVDGVADILEDDVVGMVGANVKVSFNIVTADAGAMRNIQRSVEMAGLELRGFILEPLVSAEAVLDENDKAAGVVLVDIGGGTTDVAIFKNSILCHTAVIPLAGNAITSDIRVGCNILPRQAESLKVKFGSALPSENSDEQIVSIPGLKGRPAKEISLKQLAGIIGARVEEIFGSVACEINNCECDLDRFIGGVVLTGGGAKLRHIDKVCEYLTQLNTRLGVPKEHITSDSPKELGDPVFATAIGLVIYGIRCEEENKRFHVALDDLREDEGPIQEIEERREPVHEAPSMELGEGTEDLDAGSKRKGRRWKGFTVGNLTNYIVRFFEDDDDVR